MARKPIITDQLIGLYRKLGSIHRVAAATHLSSRTVWIKLKEAGVMKALDSSLNPVLHFPSGTTVLTLEGNHGEVMTCLIDTVDYDKIKSHHWHARKKKTDGTYYAFAKTKGHRIPMHQLVTGQRGVDHRNRNGLDNRRLNLRPATSSQNNANVRVIGVSRFHGVSWHKSSRKWQAQITCNYQHTHVGLFTSEEEAARAYDAVARKLHGEFANLNFPTPEELGPTAILKVPDRGIYDAEGDPIVFDEDLAH